VAPTFLWQLEAAHARPYHDPAALFWLAEGGSGWAEQLVCEPFPLAAGGSWRQLGPLRAQRRASCPELLRVYAIGSAASNACMELAEPCGQLPCAAGAAPQVKRLCRRPFLIEFPLWFH